MRSFSTCFIIGLVYLCSCSDDDDYPTAPVGTMIATVNRPSPNDEAWQSTEALARIKYGNIYIIGSKGDEAFELKIYGAKTPGRYKIELGTVSPKASLTWRPVGGAPYSTAYVSRLEVSEAGGVTISEIDEMNKTISGTFSAEIPLPYHGAKIGVHHGSFYKIPFITEAPNDNNSFSVKVDGVNLNATTTFSSYFTHNYYQKIELRFLTTDHDITIGLFDHMGKDTYKLFSDNVSPQANYKADTISFSPPSGNVTITLHNMVTQRMEGSFNFSAVPEGGGSIVEIAGTFALNY